VRRPVVDSGDLGKPTGEVKLHCSYSPPFDYSSRNSFPHPPFLLGPLNQPFSIGDSSLELQTRLFYIFHLFFAVFPLWRPAARK
jgi:hypothetical protein